DNKLSMETKLHFSLHIWQYYYEKRHFEMACEMVRQIAKWCQEEPSECSNIGAGLAYHRMARTYSRMDEFKEAELCCDQSLKFFTKAGADVPRDQRLSIEWYMGLVWLTEGHIAWITGDLPTGERKLYTAQFLLNPTKDFINRANVAHSLGCIFHAQGKYPEAEKQFESAMNGYHRANHQLHLSRVYLHAGNNYYDQEKFRDAERCFNKSNEISKV